MLIFIIGYMGSGKTVLGRKLAGMLKYRFLDMDEMIEVSSGYSIVHYFEKFGETSFRLIERELLMNHLAETDCVIATGGGTPCYEDNMALMNSHGITVFIDTGSDTILERLSGKIQQRPLLKHIPKEKLREFIREHMNSRRVFYDQAKFRISGKEPDMEELVKDLLKIEGLNSSF